MSSPLPTQTLVIDVDGTLTIPGTSDTYLGMAPNRGLIEALNTYHRAGWKIVLYTARGMRSKEGDLFRIRSEVLPDLVEWLRIHEVPYSELQVGKPWCGELGFYVDDRAIRPSEFVNKSVSEIQSLLQKESSYERLDPVLRSGRTEPES